MSNIFFGSRTHYYTIYSHPKAKMGMRTDEVKIYDQAVLQKERLENEGYKVVVIKVTTTEEIVEGGIE